MKKLIALIMALIMVFALSLFFLHKFIFSRALRELLHLQNTMLPRQKQDKAGLKQS